MACAGPPGWGFVVSPAASGVPPAGTSPRSRCCRSLEGPPAGCAAEGWQVVLSPSLWLLLLLQVVVLLLLVPLVLPTGVAGAFVGMVTGPAPMLAWLLPMVCLLQSCSRLELALLSERLVVLLLPPCFRGVPRADP